MQKFLEEAKKSSRTIANLDTHTKNRVLREMADALIAHSDYILEHNNKGMSEGTLNNLSNALLDRLLLTQQRV